MKAAGTAAVGTGDFAAGEERDAQRPLDLVHLSRYTLGNRGLEAELLGLFRVQAELYAERLATAENDKDWKDTAHSLKGSARGLGAWELGDLAEKAEQMASEPAARALMVAQIRSAIGAVNIFIDELMA